MSKRKTSSSVGDIRRIARAMTVLMCQHRKDVTYIPSKTAINQFRLLHMRLVIMTDISLKLYQDMERRYMIGNSEAYRKPDKQQKRA